MGSAPPFPQARDTWAHRRDSWRRVEIREVHDRRGVPCVEVERNTSRRRQAIKVSTLQRNYTLISRPAASLKTEEGRTDA